MKRFLVLFLLAFEVGYAQQPISSRGPFQEPSRVVSAQISNYLKLAQAAVMRDNLALAEAFFERMLDVPAPDVQKREGLLVMGQTYEDHKVYAKAIAVYEKFNHLFPRDAEIPSILLKLGRLYRETGAYNLALDRFYNVLNAVLQIGTGDLSPYKTATLTAQFEIAETYFAKGDYQQAIKFFNMIKLLDLAKDDRDRANFRSLYCHFLMNHYPEAITLAKCFIDEFPDSPNLPQVRYIVASALKASNRPQEALIYTLDLLRIQKAAADKDPQTWAYWKRKTGNQIANDFYQQGEFLNALTIYQSLAALSDDPEWQWPVVYQMGICFERLRLPSRALEAYSYITDAYKKKSASIPVNVAGFADMAKWRCDYLKWQQTTDHQMTTLLTPPDLPSGKIPSIGSLTKAGNPAPPPKPAATPPVATRTPAAPQKATPVPTPAATPVPIPTPTPAPAATPSPSASASPAQTPAFTPGPTPAPATTAAEVPATPAPAQTPPAAPSATPSPLPSSTPTPIPDFRIILPADGGDPVTIPEATPAATPSEAPSASPSASPATSTPSPTADPAGTASPTPQRKRKPKPAATQAPATPAPTPRKSGWLPRIF